MSVINRYILSSLNDAVIPPLREPVERLFDAAISERGLPSRSDFRDLRSRVDMVEYRSRQAARLLDELTEQVQRLKAELGADRPVPSESPADG